jgi:hypothetical protein
MKLFGWLVILAALPSLSAFAGGPVAPARMSGLELRTELARRNLKTIKECGPGALAAILLAVNDTIPGASALSDILVLETDPVGYIRGILTKASSHAASGAG